MFTILPFKQNVIPLVCGHLSLLSFSLTALKTKLVGVFFFCFVFSLAIEMKDQSLQGQLPLVKITESVK